MDEIRYRVQPVEPLFSNRLSVFSLALRKTRTGITEVPAADHAYTLLFFHDPCIIKTGTAWAAYPPNTMIVYEPRGFGSRAPAEFIVHNHVRLHDPGAFTATIGDIPGVVGFLGGGSFEPLCYRTRFRTTTDSKTEVMLDDGAFKHFRSGFWDDAEIRVYRPRNGKLIQVRQDRVTQGGYVSSGWRLLGDFGDQLVHPQRRQTVHDPGRDP